MIVNDNYNIGWPLADHWQANIGRPLESQYWQTIGRPFYKFINFSIQYWCYILNISASKNLQCFVDNIDKPILAWY